MPCGGWVAVAEAAVVALVLRLIGANGEIEILRRLVDAVQSGSVVFLVLCVRVGVLQGLTKVSFIGCVILHLVAGWTHATMEQNL